MNASASIRARLLLTLGLAVLPALATDYWVAVPDGRILRAAVVVPVPGQGRVA